MINNSCLKELIELPHVDGAFLSHEDGRVIAQEMPSFLAPEQLQKAARILSQNRSPASATVGSVNFCEFRYSNYRIFVYYLPKGQLMLLCSPQVNPARIALEVDMKINDLTGLIAGQVPAETKETIPKTPHHSESTGEKKSRGFLMPMLISVAFLLIALLGVGFFFLWDENHTQQQNMQSLAKQSEKNSQSVVVKPPTPLAPPTAVATAKKVPSEIILRLHGSNTIGARLAPALVETYLKQKLKARQLNSVPGKQNDEQVIEAMLPNGKKVAVEIHAHGSSTSFKDLDKGLCDIGMASRPIKDKEVTMLSRFGNMTSPASEHILALDGIAVIVHPANHIENLSQRQIAAIFSGKISDWSEYPASGLSGPIHVIARDEKSGTWDTFKHLVLRGEQLNPQAERIEDSRELTNKVATNTNAIGFIGLPYIKPAKAISVSETGTDAVYPTQFTVATEDYPLARRLFLYLPENTTSTLSRSFIEFALGLDGQKIAQNIGFVELTIGEQRPVIPANAPQEYLENVKSAVRLSLNFRFRSGSSNIDNRGLRDIDRLVKYLNTPENRNKRIKLYGFSDSLGQRDANCALSANRAEKVASVLQAHGVQIASTQGYCDDMPVASNESATGRERNRRVEVWLESDSDIQRYSQAN